MHNYHKIPQTQQAWTLVWITCPVLHFLPQSAVVESHCTVDSSSSAPAYSSHLSRKKNLFHDVHNVLLGWLEIIGLVVITYWQDLDNTPNSFLSLFSSCLRRYRKSSNCWRWWLPLALQTNHSSTSDLLLHLTIFSFKIQIRTYCFYLNSLHAITQTRFWRSSTQICLSSLPAISVFLQRNHLSYLLTCDNQQTFTYLFSLKDVRVITFFQEYTWPLSIYTYLVESLYILAIMFVRTSTKPASNIREPRIGLRSNNYKFKYKQWRYLYNVMISGHTSIWISSTVNSYSNA